MPIANEDQLILLMFYPPKGAVIAEPVWAQIDFSYILLFRVALYERIWVFQKCGDFLIPQDFHFLQVKFAGSTILGCASFKKWN